MERFNSLQKFSGFHAAILLVTHYQQTARLHPA